VCHAHRYATNVAANRFGAGIGVWLVGNMATNQLISTGAFEVYHDGRLVRVCCDVHKCAGGCSRVHVHVCVCVCVCACAHEGPAA
jgi:hypothetical protein